MNTNKILRPLLGMAAASAAFFCASAVTAGLVLEQTVEGSEARSETVMRIQDGMIRADICQELSTIANTKAREVMTVMHPAREVTVIRQAQPQTGAASSPAPIAPKYTVTGVTERINGYECSIVTMEVMGMKSTYWVTRTYPDYDRIRAELATVKPAGDTTPVPPELDGLILKTCTGSPGYPCITTLKSVRFEDIPASAFQAPEGYIVTRAGE